MQSLGLMGPSPMSGDPTTVGLNPTTGGLFAPTDPSLGDGTAPAPAQPMPDAWQPRHESFLGALADGFLKSRGMAPAYAQANQQANVEEAMQGFDSNPLQAIHRMAQVDPSTAYKMYNDYQDNQIKKQQADRQDQNLDRQNNIFDLQKEKYVYEKVGAMMNAAKDDDNKWQAMRNYALQYGNKLGVDVSSIIPEKRDPSAIDFITQGQVPVKDQEKIAVQQQNANTRNTAVTNTNDYRAQRLKQMQAQQQLRQQQFQEKYQQDHPKVVQTPQGMMVLDPTGTKGMIGNQLWMKDQPGHWVRVK